MSISQLSCSGGSSPSRQVIHWEENYGLAVQRAFKELGQTALDKQRAELQLLEDLRLARRKETEALQRRKAAEVLNAQDLKQQMSLRRERVYQARLEQQLPGIALNYSGYPNLPETPEHTRKQLKAERQRELKAVLDLQWEGQLTAQRDFKAYELQRERERLDKAQRELEALAMQKAQKRTKDREELTKAWEEMEKAKAIRERIESMQLKGVNPRMEPISAFLMRAGGLSADLADIRPTASMEAIPKTPPEAQKDLSETSPDPPIPEGNTSVQLPVPPHPNPPAVSQSQSFDLKNQVVRPPIIQQYQAYDTAHHSRSKGLRSGLRALGVARHSSQRTSTGPQISQDTLHSNGWTFATNQEIGKAVQPKSGRSQSQVVQPAVYVVRKNAQRGSGSRVLVQTGAHMLQMK